MFFPGLALLLTVLAFNLLGDGLQDALDPRATTMTLAPRTAGAGIHEITTGKDRHAAPPARAVPARHGRGSRRRAAAATTRAARARTAASATRRASAAAS